MSNPRTLAVALSLVVIAAASSLAGETEAVFVADGVPVRFV